MKTIFFLAFAISTSLLFSQNINSVSPNSGAQATRALAVTISGSGTNFGQATSTNVYFTQGSSTYLPGYNTVVNNASTITTYIDIPASTPTGVYSMSIYEGSSSIASYGLTSAFTVLAGLIPQISYVDTNYSALGTTLDVIISGTNTNFQSGSNTSVWFTQGSATIYPNYVNSTSATSVIANITIPSSYPTGFYDVNTWDNIDSYLTLPYGFFVSDSTVGIVSVTGDSTIYNLGDSNITIIITGAGTHFAMQGDTTIVWLGQIHRSAVPNIFPVSVHVISNTQISATFHFPYNVPAGTYDLFAFNHTDGELSKQLAINLRSTGIGSIDPDNIKVYPNPVSGKLYISSDAKLSLATISLTSLTGAVVLKQNASNAATQEVNVEHIQTGIYILTLTDKYGATTYKKVLVD